MIIQLFIVDLCIINWNYKKIWWGNIIGCIENPSIKEIKKVIAEHIKGLVIADVEVAHVDESKFNNKEFYGELTIVLDNGFQMVYDIDNVSEKKLFGRDYIIGSDGADYCESICFAINDDSVEEIIEILDKENIKYTFDNIEDWNLELSGDKSKILAIEIRSDEIAKFIIRYLNLLYTNIIY